MNYKHLDNIPSNEWDALIFSIIKPFFSLCTRDALITPEDLQQEAWIGLLNACERYDPRRAKFTTFAYCYIRGYVLRYIIQTTRHKPNQSSTDEDCYITQHLHYEDTAVEDNDLASTIFELVSDQKYADLLYKHFVYGQSFRQIAKNSGVSHMAIANRIHKVLNVLQTRLSYENAENY